MFPTRSTISISLLVLGVALQNCAYAQSKSASDLMVRTSSLSAIRPSDCSEKDSAQLSSCDEKNAEVARELSAFGRRGELIARTRAQVLEILNGQNTCAAWFQEANPETLDVFRSLHYQLDMSGSSEIYSIRDDRGRLILKYPWGAKSDEFGGVDSTIVLNRDGPFFVGVSRVAQGPASASGWIQVMLGPYVGNTAEARITIVLHELGHIVGRLPGDDGSWNGRSSRNTAEMLQHCKSDIHLIARRYPR